MNVTADMLSDVQQDIYKAYRFSNGQKDEKPNKLILNDMGKQDYVTLSTKIKWRSERMLHAILRKVCIR